MMVIFVSQCEKKALKTTRRVLDSFAERIGDNTWKTLITREGLLTVRKLLSQSATKSTAVSCHWIRSRNHSELQWIVGNKNRFDLSGNVPVHYTNSNLLQRYVEHDWLHLHTIQALTALAALFHDWGKANDHFQRKLQNSSTEADPLRHEWISVLLLGAFVSIDPESWLERIINDHMDEEQILDALSNLTSNADELFQSFDTFPLPAQIVAWLMLTHHKLPHPQDKNSGFKGMELPDFEEFYNLIDADWGYRNSDDLHRCLQFSKGLILQSKPWKKELHRWAKRLLYEEENIQKICEDDALRPLLHHARTALMLADHNYSSQDADPTFKSALELYANTNPKTHRLKQRLDEHLVGVYKTALKILHNLPAIQNILPRSHNIRTIRKPSPPAFSWQDKAVRTLKKHRKPDTKNGFFAVNLASTGTGKTVANAKIMLALSPKMETLRYTLVLGLRTLTLQTGNEYRHRLGMQEDDLAVIIGSQAIKELNQTDFAAEKRPIPDPAAFDGGSESAAPLMEAQISYEGGVDNRLLETLFRSDKERALLYAPILVTTIDHLMGSVDTIKGGRHLLPALRLLSADLVIDEIDDFDGGDLIAVGRLIHLAGMLGRKVMISSATIPPDLAEGYFHAYKTGWQRYAKVHEVSASVETFWVDEFKSKFEVLPLDESVEKSYRQLHRHFVKRRIEKLHAIPPRRRGGICLLKADEKPEEVSADTYYFQTIAREMFTLHSSHHLVDPTTGKRVSFGVVRMANIQPSIALGKYLLEHGLEEGALRLMIYHSRQILLMRHEQERYLDGLLKRKNETGDNAAILHDPLIRRHLEQSEENDILFVVIATPVEEVGRDHDFDWALIEPSSWRSIIQMAGRVCRHRFCEPQSPNVSILQYNFKAFRDGDRQDRAYFTHPGYELTSMRLDTHDLSKIIDRASLAKRLDASSRIIKPEPLQPSKYLADLEHFVMQSLLCDYKQTGPESLEGDLSQLWCLTALPQSFNPFRGKVPTVKCWRIYDEETGSFYFGEKDNDGHPINREAILNIHIDYTLDNSPRHWLERDYDRIVDRYAEKFGMSRQAVTLRYGEISWQVYGEDFDPKWQYADWMGLSAD
jgi:CRISPR-associated endonuclease/helicase Cas3